MSQSMQRGFMRDDATGALVITGDTPFGSFLASGDYFSTPIVTASGVAATAGRLTYHPIPIFKPITIQSISCHVATGVAATTARLALFADSGAFRPTGAPLTSDSGALATTASGAHPEFAVSMTLQPGLIWGAVEIEGGAPVMVMPTNPLPLQLPNQTAVGSQAIQRTGYYEAKTGAINAAPGALTEAGTNVTPLIFLRKA